LIRTVWLALICLITLAAMAAVKVGTASLVTADASDVVMPAGSNIGQALMKSDKLEVFNVESLPNNKVTAVTIVPPKGVSRAPERITKIVSRHWHDPLAPKTRLVADPPKAKSSKKTAVR
jgi:hypothetical protein